MFKPLGLILFIFACVDNGDCKGCQSTEPVSVEAALRQKIFCNYNKNIRPVKYFANQTLVQIELYPITIHLDEMEGQLTIHGNLQYTWTDNYLVWEPKEYEDIQILSIGSEEIWMPEITIDAPMDTYSLKAKGNSDDCMVSYVGKVICFPVSTIRVYCSPNLLMYPFDTQNCSLLFLSQNYAGNHLDLNVYQSGVKMSFHRTSKVWEIVYISMHQEIAYPESGTNSTFFPYLKCIIIIQRHAAGHQAIIITPGLVLAVLTLTTFFMNDMYSSRITLAGITFFCNVLYCLYFGHKLPPNGNQVPLVVTFFRDSLVVSAVAVAATILIRHLHDMTIPPQNWISALISKLEVSPLSKIFFKTTVSKDDDSAEVIADTKRKVAVWIQLATVIDRLLFLACFLVYFVLFVFFLP